MLTSLPDKLRYTKIEQKFLFSEALKIGTIVVILLSSSESFAQSSSSHQTSSQEGQRQLQDIDQRLRQRLQSQSPETIKNTTTPESKKTNEQPSPTVLINSITVTGSHILSQKEIDAIIKPFEGQKMSLTDMQKLTELLTNALRKKGYVTTHAILPPQKLTNGTLEIKIIEGRMGNVQVQGNHYFSKRTFTRRITLHQGELFDYDKFRHNLGIINQYPDHHAKATLVPGQEPLQTDIVLDVKDQLPIHAGVSYDNFLSRYVGKGEFTGTLEDNNLLGFDDALTLNYITTPHNTYRLTSARYLLPLTNSTDIGFYASQNKVGLQKELKIFEARGKSKSYSIFIDQNLVNGDNLKITANAGFDYKDVFNFASDNESRDRLRIAKTGFNMDFTDPFYGRDIINNEFSQGIPNIIGGLNSVDPLGSRLGAGGKFSKDMIDFLRLQRLPFGLSLFTKFEAQFSSRTLTATEQYQLGGIANLRGYAPGEASGDSGQSATAELTLPLYFLPTTRHVPFSKTSWNDSLRLAGFYDWGHVHLRTAQFGEFKKTSLNSLGCGIRFNLVEGFSSRVDVGWPMDPQSSDHEHMHIWFQITKNF